MKVWQFRVRVGRKKPIFATIHAKTLELAKNGAAADTRFKGKKLCDFRQIKPGVKDYEQAAEQLIRGWLKLLDDCNDTMVRVYCWTTLRFGIRVSEVSFVDETETGLHGNSFMAADGMEVPGTLERWLIDHFHPEAVGPDDTAIYAANLRRLLFSDSQNKKLLSAMEKKCR